jgi:thioredoxin-related protein
MRRIYGLKFLLAAGLLPLVCTACSGIEWEYDFTAAESRARLEQKDLFVYFRQWYSPQCGRLENDWLLTAPEVKSVLKDTVNCWLEWNWSEEIARKYQVPEYPAFVVVRPNRRYSVGRRILTLPAFLAFMERAKSPPPQAPAAADAGR